MEHSCNAVIVAAGNSSRMGAGQSKQFLTLLGVPILIRTLQAFEQAVLVNQIVVVCRGEDREQIEKYRNECNLKKITVLVEGGDTRQKSVVAGINAVGSADYYAIHDGARPLVSPEEIDRVIRDAMEHGASTLATPVKDTIKVADKDGMIVSTPERSTLWAVQTPQVFQQELYRKAIEQAMKENADYTDDCQLVEHIGVRVHLCLGEYTNLKITTKDDISAAEAVLKYREAYL